MLKLAQVSVTTFMFLALSMVATTVEARCIEAGGVSDISDCLGAEKGPKDCLVAWSVNYDGNGGPPVNPKNGKKTSKVVCQDGAACDADGHRNGACSFAVGACVNAGDSCDGAALTNLLIKKPSAKDISRKSAKAPHALYILRTVSAALNGLMGDAGEACTADDLKVEVPLRATKGTCATPAGERCLSDQDCDDYCVMGYKKNKAIVKVIVSDGGSKKDADALKFFCLPSDGTAGTGATASRITDAADVIGGPLSMGRSGDWLLKNGNIRVTVRDVGRVHSFMLTNGGHILDADLVRSDGSEDRDNWLGIQPLVNISQTQGTDDIFVLNDGSDGNPAILRTSGPDDLFDSFTPEYAIYSAGNTLSIPPDTLDNDMNIDLVTDYIIRPDTNYVQVATTVKNLGGEDLNLLMGDYMNPGGELETFGPGLGFGEPLLRLGGTGSSGRPQGLDYIAFQGVGNARGVTYGVVFPPHKLSVNTGNDEPGTYNTGVFGQSGIHVWGHGQHLVGLLNSPPVAKPTLPFLVPAGGENTLRRWFVVGDTVSDVTTMRERNFGKKLGVIQGTVSSAGQPVANAHVAFIKSQGNGCGFAGAYNCANVYSATLTDEHGFYRAFLPQSSYQISARASGYSYEGGGDFPNEGYVNLRPNKTATVDIALPATGILRVVSVDQNGTPLAAKTSVVGHGKSPDPGVIDSIAGFIDAFGRYFGYPPSEKDSDTFGLAAVLFSDYSGDTGDVEVEPGNYHIVVSHGNEYDVYDQAVTISAGQTTTVNATVNQVVDSTGFVSIDTHVHMIMSPDSAVPKQQRITTMLAAGVDFFVPTDHDLVHDLEDDVAAMGASAYVKTAPSNEVTTFTYGHFNVWPQTVDESSIIGGALDWGRGPGYPSAGAYDLSPAEIFASFDPANQVIQINHFNSGTLGHFNNLGIDTVAVPPTSTSSLFRCHGGFYDGLPCYRQICLGGGNEGADCSSGDECPAGECFEAPFGRHCGGGDCTDEAANLGSFLRLYPSIANLYDDGYTALEVWIESNRAQMDLFRGDNLGDWAGLLNQGSYKTGIADSDTHQNIGEQAGGPRTYVASSTDDPASIDPTVLAQTVNAGRAFGSNGPFVELSLVAGSGANTAGLGLGTSLSSGPSGGGPASLGIAVSSPPWAEFDTIEVYVNSTPDCVTEYNYFGGLNKACTIEPLHTLVAGTDFNVALGTGQLGAGQVLSATASVNVPANEDGWVLVVVRGTDGVSKPLFPVRPKDLAEFGNATLAGLTNNGQSPPWNLNEEGVMAMAFTNPLFIDADNDGVCVGGSACP